jgi:hypothetical protein
VPALPLTTKEARLADRGGVTSDNCVVIPNFAQYVQEAARRTDALLAELKETERCRQATAKFGMSG